MSKYVVRTDHDIEPTSSLLYFLKSGTCNSDDMSPPSMSYAKRDVRVCTVHIFDKVIATSSGRNFRKLPMDPPYCPRKVRSVMCCLGSRAQPTMSASTLSLVARHATHDANGVG